MVSGQAIKGIYLTPFLFFVIFFFSIKKSEVLDKIEFNKTAVGCLILYGIVFVLSTMINIADTRYNLLLRDIVILSSPVILLLINYRFTNTQITIVLATIFLSFFIVNQNFKYIFGVIASFDIMFLINPTRGVIEYDMGVILGLPFIYLFHKKKWWGVALAFFIILLSGKRVIIMGLMPTFFFYYFFKNLKGRSIATTLYITFAVFFCCSVFLPEIAEVIAKLVGLGDIPVGYLLMGRDTSIYPMRDYFMQSDFLNMIFGNGPASADIYLGTNKLVSWESSKPYAVNPHNDMLKLLLDYGIFGLFAYITILIKLFSHCRLGILMALYTIAVLCVDNSLIFIVHLLLMAIFIREKEDNEINELPQNI